MAERRRQRVRDLRIVGVEIDTVRTAPPAMRPEARRGRFPRGRPTAFCSLTLACLRTVTPAGGGSANVHQRQAFISAHGLFSQGEHHQPCGRATHPRTGAPGSLPRDGAVSVGCAPQTKTFSGRGACGAASGALKPPCQGCPESGIALAEIFSFSDFPVFLFCVTSLSYSKRP